MRSAVVAFALRGGRRATMVRLLVTSLGLLGLVLLVAAWLAMPTPRPETVGMYVPDDGCYGPAFTCVFDWLHAALGLADAIAVGIVALLGLLVAPASVAAQVAQERRAGTLDQLRTTPLSPLGLALGLAVGAPMRVYLLAAGPLALHLALGLVGAVPLGSTLLATAVLVAGTAASVTLGLAASLAPRQESGGFLALVTAGALAAIGFVATAFTSTERLPLWGALHPLGALHAAMSESDSVWRHLFFSRWVCERQFEGHYAAVLPLVPLLSCLFSLALTGLLAVAVCRKLAQPERPLLGKPTAVALFLGVAAALLVPLLDTQRDWSRPFEAALAVEVLLVGVGTLLLLLATPSAEGRALARRLAGGRRLPLFGDAAGPLPTALAMAIGLVPLLAGVALIDDHVAGDEVVPGHAVGALWLVALLVALAPLVEHIASRAATAGARWTVGALTLLFALGEVVAAIAVVDRDGNLDRTVVRLAALALFAVPILVGWRLRLVAADEEAAARRQRAAAEASRAEAV